MTGRGPGGNDDVERAVGLGEAGFTRLELAAQTGIDPEQSKRFWRAWVAEPGNG